MSFQEIMTQIQGIFEDVFEDDDIVVEYETNSQMIEDWDSLNHIELVMSIEKTFNIKFTTQEISAYENVGEMAKAIQEKINANEA